MKYRQEQFNLQSDGGAITCFGGFAAFFKNQTKYCIPKRNHKKETHILKRISNFLHPWQVSYREVVLWVAFRVKSNLGISSDAFLRVKI